MTKQKNIDVFFIEPYYTVKWNKENGNVTITSIATRSKGRELTISKNGYGYLKVKMNNRTVVIHQMIGERLFGNKKKGYVINHIDCNKINNSKDNLEYVTIAENIKHSVKNGTHVASDPKRNGRYKDGRSIKSRLVLYKHEWYLKKKYESKV